MPNYSHPLAPICLFVLCHCKLLLWISKLLTVSNNSPENTQQTPHLTAPSGVPSSSPWISRWFSLTKVFSLAGVVATISLLLEGEPALPLVEADWQLEKAGVPRGKRLPPPRPWGLGKLVVLLLPSSISSIAEREQDRASGSSEREQTLMQKDQGERAKRKRRVCFLGRGRVEGCLRKSCGTILIRGKF